MPFIHSTVRWEGAGAPADVRRRNHGTKERSCGTGRRGGSRPATEAKRPLSALVECVSASFCFDGGFVVGDFVVECDGRTRVAFESLVDVYHPRLDVFRVEPVSSDGAGLNGTSDRLRIAVQCAVNDAQRMWRMLELRLRIGPPFEVKTGDARWSKTGPTRA